MVRFLIHRPIAVFMAFLAFFILGIITYINIPVSLLPDIAIPEITVHLSGKNNSARELESTVVSQFRHQLLQINKLRDIRSETRDGNAVIRLQFEYGTNTDLAFIEVNEKIDATMGRLPKEIERPRAVKASATDIPVMNLHLTLREKNMPSPASDEEFLNLCEFAETVIKHRIEQLPEVSMADITGTTRKQIVILPDKNLLETTGIRYSDIESVLNNNNIDPGSMVIKDGYYEYNISFSSVMRTLDDIKNIYINKNSKLFQLKDIAEIGLSPEKEKGLSFYNGKRAVTLAIIKKGDENMDNLQKALDRTIAGMRKNYPEIEFNIAQNQTELLDYTISNLHQNLLLAFIFVCLVSVFFLRDSRLPVIIGIGVFISLIISLLFFYLFHVSLNVVSLTGLILAIGMMIDNSIIVTDNISQYIKRGKELDDACVIGTNEVITPMLSSSLTTICVFVPLIFMSGIAGALFFDQAFSVTIGLFVSYLTGIILLPVLYRSIYRVKPPKTLRLLRNKLHSPGNRNNRRPENPSLIEKVYHKGICWTFRHKLAVSLITLLFFPACICLFRIIPKEKMPEISHNELQVSIDWNENIHVNENVRHTNTFLQAISAYTSEHSALVGEQQYLLKKEQEQTSSETDIYLKVRDMKNIPAIKSEIETYFHQHHPAAIVSFAPTKNIFEKIFVTGEPDLTAEFYTLDKAFGMSADTIRRMTEKLKQRTGQTPVPPSFQKQLNIHIDRKKMLLYNISYNEVYNVLKESFKENQVALLRSYQQYLPIMLNRDERGIKEILNNTLINAATDENGRYHQLPLSTFVTATVSEDIKTIVAGKDGEYIPFSFYETKNPEQIMTVVKAENKDNYQRDVVFSGAFFSNQKMITELTVILIVSILLMYFILAAQFESFIQPLIVLLEIPIDITAALGLLLILGHSLNLMSAIGIIVTCGIIINDSILKMDVINQLRKEGTDLISAIHEAGRRRLNAILMTSLTSIVCMVPLLFSHDLGSELEKPLAIATIGGMAIGTLVSLFIVPLAYWFIYHKQENGNTPRRTTAND